MHSRTQEVLQYLDERRKALWVALDAISPDRYGQPPPAGGWSIAEIVEHLAAAEARIATFLMQRIHEARESGLGPETETDPVIPTMDVERMLDRNQAIEAPAALRPQQGLDVASARAALERSRETLREGLLAADGLALSQVTAPHRHLGPIDVYQWLVFVGTHEARHTEQIRVVAAALAAV